jgi:hypothetical protein
MLLGMAAGHSIRGEIRQCDNPEWGPLEALLGSDDLCSHFMWMGDVELEDGTILNAYKHSWTRRYLHLADDGRTFDYLSDVVDGDGYRRMEPYLAMGEVFARWGCCEPTPEERAALRAALHRALLADE